MRYFSTLILWIFCSFMLQAQDFNWQPLTGNPVLEKAAAQKQKRIQNAIDRHFGPNRPSSRKPPAECANNPGNVYSDGESAYVVSGEEVKICIDTVGFDTLKCQNCDAATFGTVTQDTLSEICFIYQADNSILLEEEQLFFQKCDSSNTNIEEVSITIVIKRPGVSITEAEFMINEGATRVICAPSINLPGDIVFSRILDCNDPAIGTPFDVTDDNECLFYAASNFAEPDTVCVEFCDINCVCDTALLPIQIVGDTMSLPFFDDFSYSGPYPSEDNWLDNNVYVNHHFPHQAPSIGAATFDGLDASGTPYGNDYGRSDVLTSNYFDLSGRTPSDNTYLSFYYQNKGNGFIPDFEDSLIVEFKLQNGEWEQVLTIADGFPYGRDSIPPFRDTFIMIDNSDHLYDGFQFRFVGFGPRTGISSNWHLDYVRLDETAPIPPDGSLDDLAFSIPPDFILKNYSSMPFRQFENFEQDELLEDYSVGLFNNFMGQSNVDRSAFVLDDITNNQLIFENPTGFITNIPGGIAPQAYVEADGSSPITMPLVNNLVSGLEFQEYELTYVLNSTGGQASSVNYPGVIRNDTVRRSTVFDNYLAYDDGTAEKTVSIQQRWIMAVEFELNAPDTLRAIQLMHPHFRDNAAVRFDLLIWENDIEGEPIYREEAVSPFYPDANFDTLQAYTTYPIVDENKVRSFIPLNPGKFYIGWEQVNINQLQVGVDVNSLRGSTKIFFRDNIGWLNQELNPRSSLCVRALLGSETPISTSVEEHHPINREILFYPNPSRGTLNFELGGQSPADYQFELFSPSGQLLMREPLTLTKQLAHLGEGLFFVRLTHLNTQESTQYKLFLTP